MKAQQLIPIFRMFDETKAREFYLDFLGFEIAFEHRFEADTPLYMGIVLDGCELHLSEHHGDAAPGSSVRLEIDDIGAYHETLSAKKYKYARPGILNQDWGFLEMIINDPFGNRLVFCQPKDSIIEERRKRSPVS